MKKLLITATIASLMMSGCSNLSNFVSKRDNGRLDYQQSQLLAPLQLPVDQQAHVFTPLYTIIDIKASNLQNTTNKSYKLPRPKQMIK